MTADAKRRLRHKTLYFVLKQQGTAAKNNFKVEYTSSIEFGSTTATTTTTTVQAT